MTQSTHVDQAQLDAYIASLPVDDEPLSAEDVAAIEAGRAAAARGDVLTHEQMQRCIAIVEAVEGGSYPLWQMRDIMKAKGIVPADWTDTQVKTLLDELVADEMIAGDERGYWQHGRARA